MTRHGIIQYKRAEGGNLLFSLRAPDPAFVETP
jgi:hypothetical protein